MDILDKSNENKMTFIISLSIFPLLYLCGSICNIFPLSIYIISFCPSIYLYMLLNEFIITKWSINIYIIVSNTGFYLHTQRGGGDRRERTLNV